MEREKVIKELELIRDYDPMFRVSHDDVFKGYAEDALALLKAQEPVEPTRKPEIFNSLYSCGKCSAKVGFQIRKDDSWRFKCKFCPNCGRAVKWK